MANTLDSSDAHQNLNLVGLCAFSGALSSGKTSVGLELRSRGIRFEEEFHRQFVESEMAKGRTIEEITADRTSLRRQVLAAHAKWESALPTDELIVLDRTVADGITYFRLTGLDPAEVSACLVRRYVIVFLFDRLPIVQDGVRTEDEETAAWLDINHELDYRALGYQIVRVPVFSADKETNVKMRADFILTQLGAIGDSLSDS